MTDAPDLASDFSVEAFQTAAVKSLQNASPSDVPYRHWNAVDVLPADACPAICALPFAAPDLAGVSGKRELHNATRTYFDVPNRSAFEIVDAAATAFQSPVVTTAIEQMFGASLQGSYLRMEYAQDVEGFWLEPHSDLGVKLFTLLLYLSDDPRHADLGTDIYDSQKRHVGRSGFHPGHAMIFVPSDNTIHGFEPRSIAGVRKSLIINYVTDAWRAREQLAFPDHPIGV